jgi:uncharacterized protein (DUF885 family)
MLVIACTGCGAQPRATMHPPPPSVSEPAARLAALVERIWEWKLEVSPELGTYVGDGRRDDRLSDHSDAGRRRVADQARALREELRRIDPATLTGQDRITWDVVDVDLEQTVEAHRLGFHLWRVDHMYGIHISFAALVRQDHPRRSLRDLENMVARYRQYPREVDAVVANLRVGLSRQMIAPRESVRRTIAHLDLELAKAPAERTLALDAAALPEAVPLATRLQLARAANEVVEREILPAWARLRALLADEVLPRTREEVGIWTVPNGAEAYRFLVGRETSLSLPPQEIHDRGLAELAAIEAEMTAIVRRLGHSGELASFARRIREDPANHLPTREALLEEFRRIHDRAWLALPRAFGRLPGTRSEVRAMEAFLERDSPAAYYGGPTEDGSRPGIFWANLYQPGTRPRYNMEALTFHEAVPGHHLQIAIASELLALPPLRRHADSTAYVEGWALYAERLCDELGLYSGDLARFGMLGYQAWRASRLVVDTGIHHLRWSRAQALEFMGAHTLLPPNEVENEVDRYVVWPGQALAYMIGALEIRRLRASAEAELGDRFDLRAFHDVVLGSGAVGLPTLGRIVDEWIARRRGG